MKNDKSTLCSEELHPDKWVKEHGDYLYQFAIERTGDREAAKDLAQETFLSAWNSREHFRRESSLRTWLTSILKYKIFDYYRKNSSRNESLFSELLSGHGSDDADWIMDISLFPEAWRSEGLKEFEFEETYRMFLHCTNNLPSRLMEIAMFAEVDGLTGKEISEKLSLSTVNVRQLLSRARKMIRECMRRMLGLDQD